MVQLVPRSLFLLIVPRRRARVNLRSFLHFRTDKKHLFYKINSDMPGLKIRCEPLPPKSNQPGLAQSLLYSGSRFQGQQKSKGNCYDVEVVLQVNRVEMSNH